MPLTPSVAVLFARSDSVYKSLPGCDVYDIDRDAMSFSGGLPVVAHPPCRSWAKLRKFSKPRPCEKLLSISAIRMVRQFGGVLEHPAGSLLWKYAGLPAPGKRDAFGGFSIGVNQLWFGHKAEKSTLLYVCGCNPSDLPEMPFHLGYPSHVVQSKKSSLPHISKSEREHTPLAFAQWLVDLANRCQPSEVCYA